MIIKVVTDLYVTTFFAYLCAKNQNEIVRQSIEKTKSLFPTGNSAEIVVGTVIGLQEIHREPFGGLILPLLVFNQELARLSLETLEDNYKKYWH